MPHRLSRTKRRADWRQPVLQHVLGLGPGHRVDVLKKHLADAQLAEPGAKINAVMVESFEHYEELLEHGVPMARADDAPDPPDDRRYVLVRRCYLVALWAGVALMPSVWMWPTRIRQAEALLERLF